MKHSLLNRILLGKITGLVFGLFCIFAISAFGATLDIRLSLGLILFFIITGVLTALAGIIDHHPIFNFKMPFWFRGGVLGLTMYLLLFLLSYDKIVILFSELSFMGFQNLSPYWLFLEGIIAGILFDWIETKFAGEGFDLPLK